MDVELTKAFAFSSSYRLGSRSIGRNYTLWVTVSPQDEAGESELEALVRAELIDRLHTRDLSENVDFLKGLSIDDVTLLQAFRKRLENPLKRHGLRRLALQRDAHTVTTLHL